MRDVSKYADPTHIATMMKFMLDTTPALAIPELLVENR